MVYNMNNYEGYQKEDKDKYNEEDRTRYINTFLLLLCRNPRETK